MDRKAERRIIPPQLRAAGKWLRVKWRVLGSGNGNGIWYGQFWPLYIGRNLGSLSL
jgi:hypothetical protein